MTTAHKEGWRDEGVGDTSAWYSVLLLGFIDQGHLGHSKCWGSFLEAHTLGKLFPRIRATRSVTKFLCQSLDQG